MILKSIKNIKKIDVKNTRIKMRKFENKFNFIRFFAIIFVAIFLIVIIFPLLWMFSLSLRAPHQVTEAYAYLIPKEFANNYSRGFEWAREKLRVPLPVLYKNSIIITFSSVLVTIIIATIASFSLSKLRFRGKNFIFYAILFGMMIPTDFLPLRLCHMISDFLLSWAIL